MDIHPEGADVDAEHAGEAGGTDAKGKKKGKKKAVVTTFRSDGDLSVQERVDVGMMHDADRHKFLVGELRYLRYECLTLMKVWEGDMANYRTAVANWRESRTAYLAIGVAAGEAGPPPLMPGCPSHLPSDPQLQSMIVCARKEGKDAYRRVMAPSTTKRHGKGGRGSTIRRSTMHAKKARRSSSLSGTDQVHRSSVDSGVSAIDVLASGMDLGDTGDFPASPREEEKAEPLFLGYAASELNHGAVGMT